MQGHNKSKPSRGVGGARATPGLEAAAGVAGRAGQAPQGSRQPAGIQPRLRRLHGLTGLWVQHCLHPGPRVRPCQPGGWWLPCGMPGWTWHAFEALSKRICILGAGSTQVSRRLHRGGRCRAAACHSTAPSAPSVGACTAASPCSAVGRHCRAETGHYMGRLSRLSQGLNQPSQGRAWRRVWSRSI